MKNHRVMWTWKFRLLIADDATLDQEDALLDAISEVIDDCQIADFIRDRVGPYGVRVEVME